jgi:hypothetical protein
MTHMETELTHLVSLMQPPFREQWKAYCWAKANALAASSPADYADLPAALLKRMRNDSKDSGPKQPSITNQRSNE